MLDAFEFLMSPTDRVKYHMLKWVLDNPIPKIPRNKHRNWKRFMSWVEQHDEKYDELKSEYIN